MKNPDVTVSLKKLYSVLRRKELWSDRDEQVTARSRLKFHVGPTRMPVNDDEDLEEGCKRAELMNVATWDLSIDRGAKVFLFSF